MAFVIPVASASDGSHTDGQIRISEDEPDKGSLEVALSEAEHNKARRFHGLRTYFRKFKGGRRVLSCFVGIPHNSLRSFPIGE
jgi:hypothetical protein